jgi:hypothetical protein
MLILLTHGYSDTYRMQRLSTHRSDPTYITGDATFEVVNDSQMTSSTSATARTSVNSEVVMSFTAIHATCQEQIHYNTPVPTQVSLYHTMRIYQKSLITKEQTYPTGYHSPSTFQSSPLDCQYSEISTDHSPLTSRRPDWSDGEHVTQRSSIGENYIRAVSSFIHSQRK